MHLPSTRAMWVQDVVGWQEVTAVGIGQLDCEHWAFMHANDLHLRWHRNPGERLAVTTEDGQTEPGIARL